jgi:uncharacterized protein (DUF2236 family)
MIVLHMDLDRAALSLLRPARGRLETGLSHLLRPAGSADDDFLRPHGEAALLDASSVSWKIFKNPLALFVGGIAAVVLELAEPRVRTGVWEHTSFRERPLDRLRRTGYAATMTVYGPRSRAESMIAAVRRMHARVHGTTPGGTPFRADDAELLEWVHATVSFGFLEAYHGYVEPLSTLQRDRFHAEGVPVARLYGCASAPASQAALEERFERMAPRLEGSAVVDEFLRIVRRMPALPLPLRSFQPLLVEAAVDLVPAALRQRIGLGDGRSLSPRQRAVVSRAGRLADRLVLRTNPAVQACRRLDLPDDHLYAPHNGA